MEELEETELEKQVRLTEFFPLPAFSSLMFVKLFTFN